MISNLPYTSHQTGLFKYIRTKFHATSQAVEVWATRKRQENMSAAALKEARRDGSKQERCTCNASMG